MGAFKEHLKTQQATGKKKQVDFQSIRPLRECSICQETKLDLKMLSSTSIEPESATNHPQIDIIEEGLEDFHLAQIKKMTKDDFMALTVDIPKRKSRLKLVNKSEKFIESDGSPIAHLNSKNGSVASESLKSLDEYTESKNECLAEDISASIDMIILRATSRFNEDKVPEIKQEADTDQKIRNKVVSIASKLSLLEHLGQTFKEIMNYKDFLFREDSNLTFISLSKHPLCLLSSLNWES